MSGHLILMSEISISQTDGIMVCKTHNDVTYTVANRVVAGS